jgi:hypothetical protein
VSEPFTDDDYERAIAAAVSAGHFRAVEQLLIAYAARNPNRAALVFDTMRLGIQLRDEE